MCVDKPLSPQAGGTLAVVASAARKKMDADFEGSCLNRLGAMNELQNLAEKILHSAAVDFEKRKLAREATTPVSSAAFHGITRYAVERFGRALDRAKRSQKLQILSSAIAVGAVAVINSLQQRLKLSDLLEVQYHDVNSVEEMRTIATSGAKADFVIAADPAFYLHDLREHNYYRELTRLFVEDQFLLKVDGSEHKKAKVIFVYPNSSADLHHRVWCSPSDSDNDLSRPWMIALERINCDASDLPDLAKKLHPDHLLIAWEPLASSLIAQSKVERQKNKDAPILTTVPGSHFPVIFSLNVREDIADAADREVIGAFKELFIAEWNYCWAHRTATWKLLEQNIDFIQYFGAGAGIEKGLLHSDPNSQGTTEEVSSRPVNQDPDKWEQLGELAISRSEFRIRYRQNATESLREADFDVFEFFFRKGWNSFHRIEEVLDWLELQGKTPPGDLRRSAKGVVQNRLSRIRKTLSSAAIEVSIINERSRGWRLCRDHGSSD